MKKLISIILMLALMLSLFQGISFAQEVKTEIDAMEILKNISVIDKDISSKTYVTRADFIRMAVNIAKGDKALGGYAASYFADVNNTHEDFKHICYAGEYKIVSGDELGNFNPDKPITYAEAAKILVSMLGYEPLAKVKGGWPTGYIYMASSLKLDMGVEVTDEMLSPASAANLVLNALECETMDVSSIENGSFNFKTTGKPLIYTMMDIGIYEGVLTENQFAGINIPGGAGTNSVKIGALNAASYTTDAEKYLGCSVRAYYRVENGKNVVLSIYPSSDNRMWEIKADDFVEFTGDALSYIKDGSDKINKLKVEGNVTVIFNGKNKDDYDADTFKINSGIIRVVDNDSDGRAELINIESYQSYPISSVNTKEPHIYAKYGSSYDVDTTDSDVSAIFYDSKGYEIALENLKEGDTLSLMASEDGKYLRGIVSTAVISGTVDAMREESTVSYATVSGKEYKISADIPAALADLISVGANGTFQIDAFGSIAYIEMQTRNKDYAMIIDFAVGQGIDSTAMLKIMDVYGVKNIYPIAKKCKINGAAYTSFSDLQSILNVPTKMILYKLNSQMEIAEIETSEGDVLISLGDKAKLAYRGNQRWFAGKLSMTTSTPVMVYPASGNNEDDYMVTTSDFLIETDIEAQGFTTRENSYNPEVVAIKEITDQNLIKRNDPSIIVTKIVKAMDPTGDVMTRIYGYLFSGKEVWFGVKNESLLTGLDIEPGDMVKIKRDPLNYIIAIDKFYDAGSGSIDPASAYSGALTTASFYVRTGYIYDNYGTQVGFSVRRGASTVDDVTYYVMASDTVYLVLETMRDGTPKVTVADSSVMQDYLNNGVETKVLLQTDAALTETVIVLK